MRSSAAAAAADAIACGAPATVTRTRPEAGQSGRATPARVTVYRAGAPFSSRLREISPIRARASRRPRAEAGEHAHRAAPGPRRLSRPAAPSSSGSPAARASRCCVLDHCCPSSVVRCGSRPVMGRARHGLGRAHRTERVALAGTSAVLARREDPRDARTGAVADTRVPLPSLG